MGSLGFVGREWQGEGGLDTAFSHKENQVLDSLYLNKCTMKAFGPVENGSQCLFGLDCRSAMWRGDEETSLHTEVGYRLWSAAATEVVRAFVVPRGITVLAGGFASADADTFTLRAEHGAPPYSIGENQYLAKNASTLSYEVAVTSAGDTWSYDETTMLRMNEFDSPLAYFAHNTLRRLA